MKYADTRCTYTEDATGYTYSGPCMVTGETYVVKVPRAGLFAYRQGAMIQNAFPEMSADDREFLLSGISPAGWKQMFADNPDDGWDD